MTTLIPNALELINLNNISYNTYCNTYNEKKIMHEIINKDNKKNIFISDRLTNDYIKNDNLAIEDDNNNKEDKLQK